MGGTGGIDSLCVWHMAHQGGEWQIGQESESKAADQAGTTGLGAENRIADRGGKRNHSSI